MTEHAISEKLYAALNDEQDRHQDELDLVAGRRSDMSSLLKDYEKMLKGRITMIRQQKKGKAGVQTEIPGTESSSGPHRHPAVDLLLKAAEGIPTKVPRPTPAAPSGKPALALDALVGSREDAIARHESRRKKTDSSDLEWLAEEPGIDVAQVKGGAYAMVSGVRGYTVRWRPASGRERVLARDVTPGEARSAAAQAETERQADLLVGPELTQPALRGPAAARKKGRR